MAHSRSESARFTVDTHLFRELGQFLVGRESTALIELVKNAYDADATQVTVHGENLRDPERGVIRISDNGNGMDPDTFSRGFLRVAARMKADGSRKSARFGRRFTGAKGIGRLAAHKLARRIEVESIPHSEDENSVVGVHGVIDWDKVEAVETLDQIDAEAVSVRARRVANGHRHGTLLRLTGLRQRWTDAQRSNFLREVEGLQAPRAVVSPLPPSLVSEPALFDVPRIAEASSKDPGFRLRLEGDFETGEDYWPAVLDAAHWLLEIDAAKEGVRYAIAPTRKTQNIHSKARKHQYSTPHPQPDIGPSFHVRLLLREGASRGGKDERAWSSRVSGVRVYMEGFRVLPYGEDSDDWLRLERDYNSRDRKLRFLDDSAIAAKLREVTDEGLLHLTNKHYLGGVFLTAKRAGSLEMLINREGFVPDGSFDVVLDVVRRGIDLLTRVRASTKSEHESHVATAGDRPDEFARPREPSLKKRAESSISKLGAQAEELEKIAATMPAHLKTPLTSVAAEIRHATAVTREAIPANSMVLVLASVGTQLAAFTHEVSRLLGLAVDLESAIARLQESDGSGQLRKLVSRVSAAASDLRRAIERQAAYLIDVVTPDARRRRSRLKVLDVLNASWRLVETSAEQRGIRLDVDIDPELKTPPMFRAELMAVFANLLTNAVKAAGKSGVVRASAKATEAGLRVRLENTGVAVDPAVGERWFRPFESTTVQLDPVLGQGMGLGLGITRDLLSEIGASIAFVQPRRGAATAIEIAFPGSAP